MPAASALRVPWRSPRSRTSVPTAPSGTATARPAATPATTACSDVTPPTIQRAGAKINVMPAVHRGDRGLDTLDREILGRLLADARLSYRDLGAAVGLSANAAADRVRRLRRTGAIRSFTAVLDPLAA